MPFACCFLHGTILSSGRASRGQQYVDSLLSSILTVGSWTCAIWATADKRREMSQGSVYLGLAATAGDSWQVVTISSLAASHTCLHLQRHKARRMAASALKRETTHKLPNSSCCKAMPSGQVELQNLIAYQLVAAAWLLRPLACVYCIMKCKRQCRPARSVQ